ncbi:MAG: hypothetical protein HY814_04065, partial [Candidatus Riflebacteria bacterium]|nr:hypothetical protein [Candidatus Riflebacteria bacterium]
MRPLDSRFRGSDDFVRCPGCQQGQRRGLGILLALVVTLCVILFVFGVAHLLFSGQVFSQAAHGAGGMAAEYLATSAIEDILQQVQKDLNDPSSSIFREVRLALLLREPATLELSSRYPPRRLPNVIDGSDNRKFYTMFSLETTSVILRIAPVEDRRMAQSLLVEAAYRLNLGRRSEYRNVRVERLVGITRVAPLRPLDQVPFAIVGTTFIVDFREYVMTLGQAILAYGQTRDALGVWKEQVENKPPNQPFSAMLPPVTFDPGSIGTSVSVNLYEDQQYTFGDNWKSLEPVDLAPLLPADDSVIFAKP